MDRTDAKPVHGSKTKVPQKYAAEKTKQKSSDFPVQESLSVQESEGASGLSSWGGKEGNISLHSGSQNDLQHYQKPAENMGSMGDSGYASNNSRSSLSPENNLSYSMQASCGISSHEVDTEYRYKMDHPKRGHCIIINNTKFKEETGMGERHGSDVDAANVYSLFRKLGFDVELKHNQTITQMLQLVIRIAGLNHKDCDCFAMVLLSHGDDGIIYGTDGFMRFEELIAPLKGNGCKALIGKPKLFFVQACRGTILDEGVDVPDAMPDSSKEDEKKYKVPVEADFLYAYSSPAGHYSFRNNSNGSWFIQALCKVFEEHAKDKEIIQMLTRVNRYVALEFESRSRKKEHSGKKQVPSIVSMLTKELFFKMK